MSTTNILDLNNRIDALEKIAHNVEPIQQQIDELKAWTDSGTKDASGNPIILTDGAELEPTALTVTLEESEVGYTECVVNRDGKNKYNSETKTVGQTLNTSNGGATNNDNWELSDYIPVNGGDITLAWDSPTNFYQANFCAYDANKNFIANSGATYTGYAYSHTFTAPSGTAFVRFSWAFIVSGTEYPRTNVRVSIGATDLGYAPYTHDIASISFGETINAGSVDFITGIVTVTEPEAKTLTLTPDNITLLKGYNVIITSGSIALSYHPDNLYSAELVMDNRIAALEEKISILAGGTTGQVLTKTSDDNYDATWATLPATRTTTKKSEK